MTSWSYLGGNNRRDLIGTNSDEIPASRHPNLGAFLLLWVLVWHELTFTTQRSATAAKAKV